jgi:hypothetical protein
LSEAPSSISAAAGSWHELKVFIEHATKIEHGTLHVIIGVLAWLFIALLSRRSLSSWAPWFGLLMLISWNETVDIVVEQWPDRFMQYGEGARDLILTMLTPTILMFSIRLAPNLFRK